MRTEYEIGCSLLDEWISVSQHYLMENTPCYAKFEHSRAFFIRERMLNCLIITSPYCLFMEIITIYTVEHKLSFGNRNGYCLAIVCLIHLQVSNYFVHLTHN